MAKTTAQRSLFIPITAATSMVGALIYYAASSKRPVDTPDKTPEAQRRSNATAKRDELGGGVGLGGNTNTGGHELSGINSKSGDANSAPLEKLPSGGVGGGEGVGGANVRNIEVTNLHTASGQGPSSMPNPKHALSSMFGTGGATSGNNEDETKDTRAASNYDKTPTKRNAGAHPYEHQPRVPKDNGDKDNGGGKNESKSSSGGNQGEKQSVSQGLQGALHGGTTSEPGSNNKGFRDTKVASNHTETPTKRS
ncbi:hypothetical protein G7046_g4860 [Stylonectria norvegica]|nr:hypothetical protein G7046_g4860 [Stylonectria norvegica]